MTDDITQQLGIRDQLDAGQPATDHARTDLPAALDEITRLRASLAEAQAELERVLEASACNHDAKVRWFHRAVAAEAEVERLRGAFERANDMATQWREIAESRTTVRYRDAEQILARAEAAEGALAAVREALSEHVEAVQTFATMPAVGDHGDTRWGEGYKRASEHEIAALTPVMVILETALATPTTMPSTIGSDQ